MNSRSKSKIVEELGVKEMIEEFSGIMEKNRVIFPTLGACRKIYSIYNDTKLTKIPILLDSFNEN